MPNTAIAHRQPRSSRAERALRSPPSKPSWRDVPHQQLGAASAISGVSEATLYKAATEGRLKLVRLAGRTLVDTSSLIAFVESAVPWTPSDRGAAARAKRVETARRAWRS